MWYLMISLHALAGVISFVTGVLVLSPKRAKKYLALFYIYLLSLIGLLVFMVGAMISHWQEISSVEHYMFSGLVLLGCYMLYRAINAKRVLMQGEKNYSKYMDGIGFTLISLFDGFIIVGAIDLKFPVWIIVTSAIAAVFLGNLFIKRAKIKYLS